MKAFNMFLPEQMTERLRAASAQYGMSIAELVRRAIDAYLKTLE